MKSKEKISYAEAGVLSSQELDLSTTLLKWVRSTERFRAGKPAGRSVLDIGYFANVIDIGQGLGLALTTDGVGTKVLVAEMLGRYETIGIDCVAMNVNDIICVGAEPVSMLDYVGIEKARPQVLEAIGRGLHEGASKATINIVGGEVSQMGEVIRGLREGGGLDLIGMCIGLVKVDEVNVGQKVKPGDVIVGLRSSGIHSNGLTLARTVLFGSGKFAPETYVPELARTVGEELLEPTRIYVPAVMELLRQNLPIHALIHVTGDGFFNLTRIKPQVGFRITDLPDPQPLFKLIQDAGDVPDAEMYRVFNMGIGFCVIAPNDRQILDTIHEVARYHAVGSFEIGQVVADQQCRVALPDKGLIGRDDRFLEVPGSASL